MRIAILGTRGIPAGYGGFETFAEHLSTRLVARGHDVTVYGRAHYVSPRQLEFHGVKIKVLPTIRHKYLDTVDSDFDDPDDDATMIILCSLFWPAFICMRIGEIFGKQTLRDEERSKGVE